MNKKGLYLLLIVIAILTMAIVSCGGGNKDNTAASSSTTTTTPATTPTDSTATTPTETTPTTPTETTTPAGMELKFNNGAEPKTIDPGIMEGVPEFRIAMQIYEGLTAYNPQDLSPLPGTAESWEVSPDGLVYTFHLRTNAVWSDNTPVNAETFKYSWLRVLKPETASPYAYQLYYIKNAQKYNSIKKDDNGNPLVDEKGEALKDENGNLVTEVTAEEVGIEVVDPQTLKVTLEAPTPYFLNLMSFQTYLPVPKHVIDAVGNDKWSLPENLVCNGAFKISEWIPKSHIKFVKNETYWDKDKVKLDAIYYYPLEDSNSAIEKYINGEFDWIERVPSEKIEEMMTRPDFRKAAYLGTYFYRVNVTKIEALKDPNVRRALYLAINRDEIVNYITKAGEIPAYEFVPSNMPNYSAYVDSAATLTDAEKIDEAKKLLADAGFADGKGFPKISILYNTDENHKKIAESIQQMWKTNLGIEVDILNQEWKVYLDSQTQLNYDIARSGWIGDYVDPNTFLDMWLKDGGNNNTGWSNPQYDELINQAKNEQDSAKRASILMEAEKILMTELPILPIYHYVNTYMINSKVQGVYDNILDLHPLKEAYIENVQ